MIWKLLHLITVTIPKGKTCKYRYLSTYRSFSNSTNDPLLRWTCRSHWCGKLGENNVGEKVTITGWVQYIRLDTKFVLLRDSTGVVQLIMPEDETGRDTREKLKDVGPESSIKAIGTVRLRPDGQSNPAMETGKVEIDVETIEFTNSSIKKLPFLPSRATNEGNEQLRMKYRSLDLRRPTLQNNLRLRSEVTMKIRQFLSTYGFVDIETPTLFRRTPGGAREFIVPTRHKGKFYSLVQSPQQFKQILMVGGIDKYFQIARCYRDEGAKPDRQPEFTQVDIEMAWTDRRSIQNCIEELLQNCWPNTNLDSNSREKK